MNQQEVRAGAIAAIKAIAPEVEEVDLVDSQALRSQIDLDSMDWLNVLVGLHQRFGIDIPEADYASLNPLEANVSYLMQKKV